MTKGHNQEKNEERTPSDKAKGGPKHRTNKEREKNKEKGRNADPDPSEGSKGKNSI